MSDVSLQGGGALAARWRRRLAPALVLCALMTLATSMEAGAEGTTGVQFEGTAELPRFPCPVGAGCTGEFHGLLTGQMEGSTPGDEVTWSAALADADIDATFAYEDTSCTIGTALGTAVLSAETPNVVGTYDAAPLPRSVKGLYSEVTLSWQRVGATALVFFDEATLFLDVVGVGWIQVSFDAQGSGASAFAPHVDPQSPPPCEPPPPSDAPPLTAEVTGAAVFSE